MLKNIKKFKEFLTENNKTTESLTFSERDLRYIHFLIEYVDYCNPEEDDEIQPDDAPEWLQVKSFEFLKNKGVQKLYRGISDNNHGKEGYSWTYDKVIAKSFGDEILEISLPENVVSVEYVFDLVNKHNLYDKLDVSSDLEFVENYEDPESEVIIAKK